MASTGQIWSDYRTITGSVPSKKPPTTDTTVSPTATPGYNTGIPGFADLSQMASGNVSNLLKGIESPDITQSMNAYWGAAAGVPGSEFLKNRAVDLYGQRSQARKSQGLADLLNMLQGYSGTVVAKPGDILAQQTAAANRASAEAIEAAQRAQAQAQFESTLGFEKEQWAKQLDLLPQLLNTYANPTSNYTGWLNPSSGVTSGGSDFTANSPIYSGNVYPWS